jgi:hypothetical protein
MSILDRDVPTSIVQSITQLIAEFAFRVDQHGGLTVADMFDENGYYESDGKRSTGRAAIRAAYEQRAARGPRTSRHLFTNLRIFGGNDGNYKGTSIMLLFARDGHGVHPASPILVADVEDEYRFNSQGEPEIVSRRLTTVFVDPQSRPVLPLGEDRPLT